MPALFADSRHLADHIRHDGRATSQGDAATGRFVGGTNYIGSCSYGCLNNGSKFNGWNAKSGEWRPATSREGPSLRGEIQPPSRQGEAANRTAPRRRGARGQEAEKAPNQIGQAVFRASQPIL